MILLCWRRKYTSKLDKRRLAKAIGQIIPMLPKLHKDITAISKNVKIETRLILK